jgi:hypothetical protein
MSKTTFKSIVEGLKIDETHTKPIRAPKKFTKLDDTINPTPDYNFMADLLQLPKTKEGYHMLLVVVDLATHEFDIEPIKTKTPDQILKGFQEIFKRQYLKKPFASIQTDGGGEFKGAFEKYLIENKIWHNITVSGRHTQNSMVESLNRIIGRLLMGYMNTKEEESGKAFREWTEAVPFIREKLNEFRKVDPPDMFTHIGKINNFAVLHPKYNKGDIVLYALEKPLDALGKKQSTDNFREGDYRWSRVPKKIVDVLYMEGAIPFRYILEGMANVSFTEKQLKPSTEKESKWIVREIIDKRTVKRKIEYLVWWKGYPKAESTWEPQSNLIDDGLKDYIDEYNKKPKV